MTPASFIGRLKTKFTTPLYAETRAFYEKTMGFPLVEDWDSEGDTGCIFEIATGSHLEIYKGKACGVDGLSLQFRIDDMEGFKKAITGHWPFTGPEERPWGSIYLFMTDPAGVSIIVFEGAN